MFGISRGGQDKVERGGVKIQELLADVSPRSQRGGLQGCLPRSYDPTNQTDTQYCHNDVDLRSRCLSSHYIL